MNEALLKSEALVAKGNLLREQGKLKLAISVYVEAIKSDLNNHLGFYHLGLCLSKQKRFDEAASFYYYAIGLNPDFPPAYYALGEILSSQNKLDKAIAYYQKAIKLDPHRPYFYMSLAKAFKAKGDFLPALNCYQQVINLKPDSVWAYVQLGGIFRQYGKYEQAVKCYIKAIEIDPHLQTAYTLLEFISIPDRQLNKLITVYQQIVKNNPQIDRAWANLGKAFTQKKELKAAINSYRQACYYKTIAVYPQLAETYNNLVPKEPSFIIIGAAKCGTTSLYRYLSQHPQIVPPINKEIDFFNFNFEHDRNWYLAHFPHLPQDRFITGEASPSYFSYPKVDRRIYELFPQVKLIILLRNPVERTISHYYHRIREGSENRSLETALNSELKIIKQATTAQLSHLRGYLGISMYFYKLKRWLSVFPQDRVLIIKSENFYQETPEILSATYKFLNIGDRQSTEHSKYNSGSYKLQDERLKTQLSKFFQPHNQKLEALLNRKFDWD